MLEQILEFCLDNLDKIIYCVIAITLFIITLATKKVKIEENKSWMTELLLYLPSFITLAEEKYGDGNGQEKFKYVFNLAISKLVNISGIKDAGSIEQAYGDLIKRQIEVILSTPQKKGEN